MTYEMHFAGWGVSLERSGRKQRVRRDFCILMRALDHGSSSSSTPAPKAVEPPKKRKWSKSLRKPKPVGTPDSLMDAMVEFTKRKSKHWALVVHESVAGSDGKHFRPRLFEICGQPPPGSMPAGDTSYNSEQWASVTDDMSEDEFDDVYDPDEDYPAANKLGASMWMRVSSSIDDAFEEPDYSEGGVFWDLLDRLRSVTKFTNTEIQNEAQRIWSRQSDYRVFNNNCHRFCILLAVHLRSRQESTLRILTGNILKAQATEGKMSAPVENPLPSKKT